MLLFEGVSSVCRNKTIDLFGGKIKFVDSFDVDRNTIMLFRFLENITYDDVYNQLDNLTEIFKDYEKIDIEEENFLCEGFWIKAKNIDLEKVFNCDEWNIEDNIFVKESDVKEVITNDKLFKDAVVLVMKNGGASTSYLQRRLSIGYSRAALLIDKMELCGFVGAVTDKKLRECLITPEKFKEYFGEDFV